MDRRIHRALELMEAGCVEARSAASLAGQLGLSRWHFEHLLGRETGATFRCCLRELRLTKAILLLRDPRLRVKEVAAQCGYARACDLTRAFKACTGLSPTDFRRLQGNQLQPPQHL